MIQTIGLFIFYIEAVTYNLNIIIAGKYLRPAPSGLLSKHKLIKEGPFVVIRHPLYVSYILILMGLSLTLLTYWLLISILFMIIGIYLMAKAEEQTLIEQFGDEYFRLNDVNIHKVLKPSLSFITSRLEARSEKRE